MMTTSAQLLRLALAALAIVSAVPSSGWAQWEPYPWKNVPRTPDGKVDLNAPARRTADGHPDLSGFWVPTVAVKHLLNLAADLKPEEVPLQPWAEAVYKERIETNGKDHPGVRCWPSGIPEKNNIPDGLKLVQTPDLVLFLHESRTIYRQIFTDGRPLPRDPQPTWMGYSIGKWEGDTFVVDTIGQNGRTWLDMRGLPGTGRAASDRALLPPHHRAHRHRRHDRRSEGLHEAVERQVVLDPAAGHGSDRKHLRGEQQGPATHGREVNEMLLDLAHQVAGGTPLQRGMSPERLLQGPFSDAMTHAGQLAMLRRFAGAPVPPEDFSRADIQSERVGTDQADPVSPDDVWPEAPADWRSPSRR